MTENNYFEVVLPIRTKSEANLREHWAARAKRIKHHRQTAHGTLAWERPQDIPPLPVTVYLTRMAPRELDSDNLVGSFKGVRDGVADFFKVNDRDKRIKWEYSQQKVCKSYAVKVVITPQKVDQ